MKCQNKRLTLIEVVIVIGVVVLLALLILPIVVHKRDEARKVQCSNILKQLGLSIRLYADCYKDVYPDKNGREGLQMIADNGFLENTLSYTCPATRDIVPSKNDISKNASYAYGSGLNDSSSVDSAIVSDRSNNHDKYGNILFVEGQVRGYSGANWSSNFGGSILVDFY